MIRVLIPSDLEFKKYEKQLKKMFEDSQKKIGDTNSYEFVRDNTLFYMFIYEKGLLGGIYYFIDDGKLYLNGFAGRKHLNENLDCLILSTKWFTCNIYAEAQNRASALCLLKTGFKRKKDNLFVLER